VDWLAWAEYCYNTSYYSALHTTPFEVVYRRPPSAMLPFEPGTAWIEAAGDLLRTRDDIWPRRDIVFSKHSSWPRSTTTLITARRCSRRATGCGCASFAGRRSPWTRVPSASWALRDIQLEDELFAQAGRDVMTGLHYSRKRPTSGSV
jgi:hypothetical protein